MRKTESGQALVIVLLVMAVGLTMGLSVISRSVTDIKISQQEAESARAFSAAEAGIEQALLAKGAVSDDIGGIRYNVVPTTLGAETAFVFPTAIEAGDTQTVWLVEHDSNGNLTETERYTEATIDLYWGDEGQAAETTTPALEATLIYKEVNAFKIKRGAYDPNGGRRESNSFDSADVGSYSVGGKTFLFRKTGFTLPTSPLIPYALRLKLLYNDNQSQILGVKGTANLPSQGKCYESTATVTQTGVSRKVRQCQFYKTPPAIFDYALFSEGSLVK